VVFIHQMVETCPRIGASVCGKGQPMRADSGTSDSISAEALSKLVGAIYDCVLDPSRWPATLSAIRHELNCHNASLTLQALPSGKVLLQVADGIEPQWLERVSEYGEDIVELWGGLQAYLSLPLLEPLVLSRVGTQDRDRNRYYREWAQPQGLVDTLAIGFTRDADSIGSIGFGWHESAGTIGTRETDIARLLIPHLHRAIVITRLLDARTMVASMFEAAFDKIGTPIVLVGKDLTVFHANQSAEALFTVRMPISLENRHLVVHPRAAMIALGAAIDGICQDESAIGAKGMGIPSATAQGDLCVLHVLPLKHGRLPMASSAIAAVFVASRTTPPPALVELVQALFGLTSAESKVFERVASGSTVAQTALRLAIQPSTVRSHLLRIFEKTGTHRQGDLAILAASLATPALAK